MSIQPKHWIQHIESLVVQSLDPSMWGAVPSFPWDEFSQNLARSLNIEDLKISASTSEWKKWGVILCGLGQNPLQISVELSPLKESFSIVFPLEDFVKLASWTIHSEVKNEGFSDPYLQKGFFRYLCLEAIATFAPMQLYCGLTPKLVDMPLKDEDAYCIDIAIEHANETVWGRMICPGPFQQSFKAHFSKDWHLSLPSNLYHTVLLDLSLVVGQTQLSQDVWEQINKGDFMLLDYCSYYPNSKKGTVQLQLDHIPLFQVKLKEESIKILDYAYCFEENKMVNENSEQPISEEIRTDPIGGISVSPDQVISPKKVPISLTIEIARMRMSLDKLLKLKPGNVLELGIQPEKSINLIANGACIGRGELIQVGDTIGVKITQLSE